MLKTLRAFVFLVVLSGVAHAGDGIIHTPPVTTPPPSAAGQIDVPPQAAETMLTLLGNVLALF